MPPTDWIKRAMLDNIQGLVPSKAEMLCRILRTVGAAVTAKLDELEPGEGLGIVFRLEILKPQDGRSSPEYTEWRTAVFARDGYHCRQCGASGDLQAHHVESWAKHPEKRLDVENGLTLCVPCHEKEHPRLGIISTRKRRAR